MKTATVVIPDGTFHFISTDEGQSFLEVSSLPESAAETKDVIARFKDAMYIRVATSWLRRFASEKGGTITFGVSPEEKPAKDLKPGDVTRDLTIEEGPLDSLSDLAPDEVAFGYRHNIDGGQGIHIWKSSQPVLVVGEAK